MRAVDAKRPRGLVAATEQTSPPWAGRVPKPAMEADSFVDYGSGFLRKSCDSCVSSKRRCDGQDPCTRCLRRKKPCHYTERKKCGPRSGQKTSKGTRRSRIFSQTSSSSASDAAPTTLPASSSSDRSHLHKQHQRAKDPAQHNTARTTCSVDAGTANPRFSALQLGPSPPSHATPTLSAGELSGETTCVDYTDCSDAPPPNQILMRDVSGSSWWSEDQRGSSAASAQVSSAQPSGASDTTAAWGPRQDPPTYDGRVGSCHFNETEEDGGDVEQVQQWGDAHSSSTGGSGSGSGGSAADGDSSEDDGSEESLGQADEEVAALLVLLGKTDAFIEGFSDDDDEVGEIATLKLKRSLPDSPSMPSSQERWNVGDAVRGRA